MSESFPQSTMRGASLVTSRARSKHSELFLVTVSQEWIWISDHQDMAALSSASELEVNAMHAFDHEQSSRKMEGTHLWRKPHPLL